MINFSYLDTSLSLLMQSIVVFEKLKVLQPNTHVLRFSRWRIVLFFFF